jgi:hypothetical protein
MTAERCPAHGDEDCAPCSRISTWDVDEDGNCAGCDYWRETGVHCDSCRCRIRGDIVYHPRLGPSPL